MADRSQQTEKATPRRMQKARREGQFPTARQFVAGGQFVAFVAMLQIWGGPWLERARHHSRLVLERAFQRDLSSRAFVDITTSFVWETFLPLFEAGAALLVVTLGLQFAVTKMGLSLKRAGPDPKRLNPMKRLRELPRQNLTAALQAAILLPAFGYTVYHITKGNLENYLTLPLKGMEAGARQVTASLMDLLWKSAMVFTFVGCVDLVRERLRHLRDLRMTKQEVREEFKETEGDPHIRARIRRLRRDLLRRRMMSEVPKATAVVVNPTHYAVAIRYQIEFMTAPLVVAKGKNYLAQRIRQRATEHQVPLVENPPLAQALYKFAEVGQEIPPHLYRAVAEVLAYIFKLMQRRLPRAEVAR